jgi:hypothetical protein
MGKETIGLAHFYENKKDRTPSWEDLGGFNAHLLMEIRSAMLDVESEARPSMTVKDAVSEWIKRHPEFEFPDDEIG